MLPGPIDKAARVLEEALKTPKGAATRIMAGAGVNYGFLRLVLAAGLVEATGKGHYGRRLQLTTLGHEFLRNYNVLERLFPE